MDSSTARRGTRRSSVQRRTTRQPGAARARFADRLRKRQERARDREAAHAKQIEADAALRRELIEACRHGRFVNYTPELIADDLKPVKALLALSVPLDIVRLAVHGRTENDRLATWRDEKFLKKAGEYFWQLHVLPQSMAAPKAQTPASLSSAALTDDIDRSHHDAEDAPSACAATLRQLREGRDGHFPVMSETRRTVSRWSVSVGGRAGVAKCRHAAR
jgi:hypothetical protein